MQVSEWASTRKGNKEGMEQVKEGLVIFERLGRTAQQAEYLVSLATLPRRDEQFDAAEDAASRAINLLPEKGNQTIVCYGRRVLGEICCSKGDTEKAVHHFEVTLGIASSLGLINQLFWIRFAMALLFFGQDRFDDGHAHLERAKSYAVNDPCLLACASQAQAYVLVIQHRFEEAKPEALRALDVFEKLGAANDTEESRNFL